MIKSKYRNICIVLIKILFLAVAVISIYQSIGHKGEIMDAHSLTTIGLNSFYYIDYNMQIKLDSFKIICLTSLIIMNYAITLSKMYNFYEGLKEIIRIRSENLNQYIRKSITFYFKYILTDVIITAITIYIVMIVINVKNVFDLQIIFNLLLMAIFYMIVPFLLMFIVDRFEYFIVGLLILTIFADYFVYKLNLLSIVLLYFIVLFIAYGIILIRERNK